MTQPSTQEEEKPLEVCGEQVTKTLWIGDAVTMILACQRAKGHDGSHAAYTGDSFTTWSTP